MTVWALRYFIIVHNNEVGHLSASFAGDARTLWVAKSLTRYGNDHKLNTGVFVFLKYLVLKRELRLHASTNKHLVLLFMQYLALTLTSPVLFYFSVNLLAKATWGEFILHNLRWLSLHTGWARDRLFVKTKWQIWQRLYSMKYKPCKE